MILQLSLNRRCEKKKLVFSPLQFPIFDVKYIPLWSKWFPFWVVVESSPFEINPGGSALTTTPRFSTLSVSEIRNARRFWTGASLPLIGVKEIGGLWLETSVDGDWELGMIWYGTTNTHGGLWSHHQHAILQDIDSEAHHYSTETFSSLPVSIDPM